METGRHVSVLAEMNDAKAAHILAYLDEAMATTMNTTGSSGVPLTASALHDNTTRSITSGSEQQQRQQQRRQNRTNDSSTRHDRSDAHSLPSSIAAGGSGGSRVASALSVTAPVSADPPSPQATYAGIKKKIEALQFDKEELAHENAELRKRLEAWRDRDDERRADARELVKAEVAELRAELEVTKRRAAAQSRSLLEEREQLRRSVEAAAAQLRAEMVRREEDRQRLEAASAAAVAALRAKWAAQERAAREKWRLAECKRIKETTLQSLEPDIVLLLNRHKADKARLRETYEGELRLRDEALAGRDAEVEEVKARVQREAVAALGREQRDFASRLQEETDRVRRQLDEERRAEGAKRSQAEFFFEEERATMRREVGRLGREVLELRGARTTEEAAFHEAVARKVACVTGQSTDMLTAIKDKLTLEFACREKEAAAHNAEYLRVKDGELRRQCALERDAAIATVVHRLETEHAKTLLSSRGGDDLLRERYSQLSRDNERLRVELDLGREQLKEAAAARQRKEGELADLKDANDLSAERVRAIENRVKAQFEARVAILDSAWQGRLSELETAHARAMCETQLAMDAAGREAAAERQRADQARQAAERRHHAELHNINERVLVAVTQRETALQTQAEQIASLREAIEARDRELARHRTLLHQ